MKVLVTGASGRLGPHVVKALEDAGHDLVLTSRRPVPPEIATFDNGMQLRAALVHPVSAGVQVQLYWRADNSPQADYTVFVHYLREGEKIAQHDGQPARDLLPTSLWQPGDLILDVHNLPQIHPRAGDTLWLGLYRSDNGASVSPAGIGVPVILVP